MQETRYDSESLSMERGFVSRFINAVNPKALLVRFNLLIVFLILVAVGAFISPQFLTANNISNLLQQSSLVGIVAIGMTFVILSANIDLSVGSVAALAGMTVAIFIAGGMSSGLAVVLSLLIGIGAGLTMGGISSYFVLPSFMVTLAGLVGIRGITYLLTDGTPVTGIPDELAFFGSGRIGPIPVVGIIFIGVTVLAVVVLRFTTFGEHVYAVGSNPEAARLSGIRVKAVITTTFAISGGLAALSGIRLTARLTVGQPTASEGLELDAIAAVVLGGTSLFGGIGGVFGTFVAVFLLAVLRNIFNLMGLGSFYQMVITGVILVIALILNRYLENRGSK